jgi:hypothetical protein
VRHVISKVFLFLEKRTRPGMKDEQKWGVKNKEKNTQKSDLFPHFQLFHC